MIVCDVCGHSMKSHENNRCYDGNPRRELIADVIERHIDTAATFEEIAGEVLKALAADEDHSRSRQVDAVQVAFNDFVKKWVGPGWHGHLLDNDQNDGERMRQQIRSLF